MMSRVALLLLLGATLAAPVQAAPRRVMAESASALREWDGRIAALRASGGLVLQREQVDGFLPGRAHLRFDQAHRGVPVYGANLVQQMDGNASVSVFGALYEGIDVDVTPRITADQAAAVGAERAGGEQLGARRQPTLVVYPKADGTFELCWKVRIFGGGDLRLLFVSAVDGSLVYERSDLQSQVAEPGLGTGVLGDRKKMSVGRLGGIFYASDELRPPSIVTFDLKGNPRRVIDFLNGKIGLNQGDIAQDADNDWADQAVVDAHSYAGWTYDYFFKRMGRRGLDDANVEMLSIVHPVRREDFSRYTPAELDVLEDFYVNAFYAGDGLMVYGEGLPTNLRLGGQKFDYFSGMLDVVAHELTHGVTDYSSQLDYENESGALNESFSDMMATAVEFFQQPAGSGPLMADYLIGEDGITPGGIRSMSNPAAFRDPDHYSTRYMGPLDNGGVHINSSIPNQVFYLAIEGGRNRTSGLNVTGVGAANRAQIETVMYRAFTRMLPRTANFATARVATIQAARDLYGASSPAVTAVTQAWTAVGVN